MSPIVPSQTNQEEHGNRSSLVLTTAAEYSVCAAKEQMEMYVNCHLKAPVCLENERKPVDLVIVLDKSGSMGGQKLSLCKDTIEFLARQLSPHDRLSLICYDSRVKVEMPLTLMDAFGKEKILGLSKKINAGSATNLSGGLFAGIQEIQSEVRQDKGEPNVIKSVLLLTDGLANVGVTDSPAIIKMLEGCLKANVSLFTFGYGSDHNETMLREISDVGNGVYYFVQNVDSVSLAFADCLGGLLSVVAQSVQVQVQTENTGIRIKSIKTKKNVNCIEKSHRYEVEIGDFYAEEERDLMVLVSIDELKDPTDNFPIVSFQVKYANVLLSNFEVLYSTVAIERPEFIKDKSEFLNSHVIQQRNRLLTLDAIENANNAANSGDFSKGNQNISDAIRCIQSTLEGLSVTDQLSAGCLLNDLNECKSNIATPQIFQSRGKKKNVAKYQEHCYQRSNNIEVEEEELDDLEGAKFGGQSFGSAVCAGYRTKSKGSMLKKAFNWKK